MAIERLKSPYFVPNPNEVSAYLETPAVGSTYTFTSIGQAGTVTGQMYRVHQFSTGQNGTLYFRTSGYVDIMLVAGGGWGGWAYYNNAAATNYAGGGGGAGGLLIIYKYLIENNIGYSFSIGSGAVSVNQTNATDTIFGGYTAVAGGRGGTYSQGLTAGISGGSGGGGSYDFAYGRSPSGNGILNQGNSGGASAGGVGSGGGGYSTTGFTTASNVGGNGISINFDGIVRALCAGGGGGGWALSAGGNGGLVDGVITGGNGGNSNSTAWQTFNGTTPIAFGCGGGGGGTGTASTNNGQYGGNGSNGVLIIRYPV